MIFVNIESVDIHALSFVEEETSATQILVPVVTATMHRSPLEVKLLSF